MHILRAALRRPRLVAFALSCIMRASDPAHVRRTHSLRSGCICFAKMRRTFPLAKAQKARSTITFCQKKTPHVVLGGTAFFLAARRFSGKAFCRRQKIRPLFAYFIERSGYRSERAVANGCFCRYFGLSRVHRFFPRLRACFEK